MGLKNTTNNLKFLRLREGKFFIGKDKENPYGELEGLITNMRYKDEEYEGAPQRKLIINLYDRELDENYQLGLNVESQNYTSFVSFLKGVDITKPVMLHPKMEEGNKDGRDFKKNTILVSQNGTYAKGYFKKDDMHGAPAWKQVRVGKKVVLDKTEYLAFMEDFVNENYIAKIKPQNLVKFEDDNDLPWNN